ncbi:MAG TPA: cell division protein ZipA C-terminal FtsZ-binding domain-containing protein [Pirellulaceae bacterium]|nr:cell division protein ZipA C-terminal FtsZ-binding domain-containing protein [Pirellulaceae bacterium]
MSGESGIRNDEHGRFVGGALVIATESESRGRAALLPTKPTEDARHWLGTIELPQVSSPNVVRDYLPEPAVSWIVDVQGEGDPVLDPRAVSGAFDQQWRETFGAFMGYGRDVDSGRWTFLVSADGPQRVDRLKFDFDYIDVLNEEVPTPTDRVYFQRLEQISERMQRFGKLTVSASATPEQAAARSRLLRDLKDTLDLDAVLILQAPRGRRFDGKVVWDVMLCLGLDWGDMDCFHWRNRSGIGDDSFFSVETSTAPGYFLPEAVAAGRIHV